MSKESMMNKAAGEMPKREVTRPPAAKGGGNEVGSTKADVRGTQEGGSAAEARGTKSSIGPGHGHISGAVKELHSQHPHHHSVGGVHHTTDHIRHVPMHGLAVESRHEHSAHMRPGKSHGHPEHDERDLK